MKDVNDILAGVRKRRSDATTPQSDATTLGRDITLPLKAFYGRERKVERDRAHSLRLCHRHLRGEPPAVTLPLAAHYQRDKSFEKRRREFYAAMAKEFGFEGWKHARPAQKANGKPGRGGKPQSLIVTDKTMKKVVDEFGGMVEYLERNNDIDDPFSRAASDRDKDAARGWGDIRRRVARRIRSTNERAEGSPLSSVDLESTPSGNTGPKHVSDGKMDAMHSMGALWANLPRFCTDILDRVILNDDTEMFDSGSVEDKRKAMEDLRFSLDFAAYEYGEISRTRMEMRWRQARELWILRPAMDRARREK